MRKPIKTAMAVLLALTIVLGTAGTYTNAAGENANTQTGSTEAPAMPEGSTPPEMPDGSNPPAQSDGTTPPAKPDGSMGGAPGENGGPGGPGSTSANVTYDAVKTVSETTEESGMTINSDKTDVIALLVNGGTVTENSLTVTKTGDSNGGDNCNFYGQNAAVLVKDGAVLNIDGATITTDASGANGVFSYGGNGGKNGAEGDGTTVNISNSAITTTGSGSGGIMTTGGGTTNATNLTITTSGQSSAAIRTDRGGGTVNVEGGTYTTNGLGSPAIYSTANITVKNATLTSTLSEGVVIEGKNTVTLENVELTANNTKTNSNATHYDTIFLYQSMSGDADSGTSVFTMTGGSLTGNNGEIIHVTNTSAIINLSGVTITNKDKDNVLLTVTNDGWKGSANTAVLNASSQILEGHIIVSNATVKDSNKSTLTLNLKDGSGFLGDINTDESDRGTVNVTIEAGSLWELTDDSYVDSLTGAGSINYNGYTLYVNGKAYTADSPYGGLNTTTDKVESITIAKNSVVFKNVTKTFKAETLATTAKKYSVIKTSGGGKVSVVKYYGSSADYIKVTSKGKVTVKKGTPAGTYKIKIKVAETDGYSVATKIIKIKVK